MSLPDDVWTVRSVFADAITRLDTPLAFVNPLDLSGHHHTP